MKKIIVLLSVLLLMDPLFAQADTATEDQYLAQIVSQLQAMTPLIDAAQKQADPNARIQFQYEWLRQDLQQIAAGIQTQISQGSTQPRAIPALHDDYTGSH